MTIKRRVFLSFSFLADKYEEEEKEREKNARRSIFGKTECKREIVVPSIASEEKEEFSVNVFVH